MDVRNQPRPGTIRPAQAAGRPSAPTAGSHNGMSVKPPEKRPSALVVMIIGALVVLLLIAGFLWWGSRGPSPTAGQYQAVVLTNGQVYFGTLTNTNGTYLHLENAYYTKKQDVPASATDAQKKAVDANVSLVKVGSELYGPANSLNIKSEQVLFWQDLRPDSKVATAIASAKSE